MLEPSSQTRLGRSLRPLRAYLIEELAVTFAGKGGLVEGRLLRLCVGLCRCSGVSAEQEPRLAFLDSARSAT